RVLDSDDRLTSEIAHQFDLLVSEQPHLLAIDGNGADQLTFLQHRNSYEGASAGELEKGRAGGLSVVRRLGPSIRDWDGLLRGRRPSEPGAGMRAKRRVAPPLLGESSGRVVQRDRSKRAVLAQE